MTHFNTTRLIDSSYLVGGIHTVQVKIKSVIIFFHSKNNLEMTTELYCNLKQLFSCFLASTTLQDEILVSKISSVGQRYEDFKLLHLKQSTITDFFFS